MNQLHPKNKTVATGWRAITQWVHERFQTLDQPLFWLISGLFLVSLVAIYSASHDDPSRFYAHLRNLAMSAGLMLLLSQIPSSQMQRLAIPLFALGVLLLLAVEVAGETSKGATRWLNLGITRIQPSEMMKIAMPLMLAWLVHRRERLNTAGDWLLACGLLAIPVVLILKQPDLGTAILVAASGFFVLYLAGLPWRLLSIGFGLLALMIILLLIFGDYACQPGLDWPGFREYQRQRVCTLLDPMRDPLGKGFHTLQSMIAIGSGGFVGKGWLQGTQTQLEFIPERATDFIFAGFAEEFGFVGSAVLVGLYLGIVGRGLWIALGAPTAFARLLAGSVSLTLFTYAFVNLGMVSGILPVVGVPLPFVSYGGTAMVTLGVGLGIVFSVARDRSQVTQGFSLQG